MSNRATTPLNHMYAYLTVIPRIRVVYALTAYQAYTTRLSRITVLVYTQALDKENIKFIRSSMNN